MGRGADWSLADVQFVRNGMAGVVPTSRCWLEAVLGLTAVLRNLARRTMHGEWGTRKQRASACGRRGQDGEKHRGKPTSVLVRFGYQARVLTLHNLTQIIR